MSNHGYGSLHLSLKTKSLAKERNTDAQSPSGGVAEASTSSIRTPAEKSTPHVASNQQPSRKRKRTEDAATYQNESFEVSGETIVLNESTTEKPPKSKKRKVAETGPTKHVSFSSRSPQAGPSGVNISSGSQEILNVSLDASLTEEVIDREGHLFIDPTGAPLLYEDLTEDDEIWMVQCPKFVNPKLFIGNAINLTEKCEIKCVKEDGSKIKLDSYPMRTEAGTSKINLILPSLDEVLKIKVADLQGKLILAEQVSVPKIDYEAIMNMPKEEVSFPTNLKVRHPLLGLDIPDGPTVPLKAKRKEAKRKSMQSNINSASIMEDSSVMSQDLFASQDSYTLPMKKSKNRHNPSQTSVPTDGISLIESEHSTGPPGWHQDTSPVRSKKKKKKHSEELLCDLEVKSEISECDIYCNVPLTKSKINKVNSVNPFRFASENAPADVRNHVGHHLNSPTSHVNNISVVTLEDSLLDKSKRKSKKLAGTPLTEMDNLSRDPAETRMYPVDESQITPKKKKKKHKETSHDTVSSDAEIKREPVDPLDLGADCPMDSYISTAKKKKKRRSETVHDDTETFNEEFKIEPRDPLDVEFDRPVDNALSKSKKKKKRHSEQTDEDIEFSDVEFKYEPKDPLDLGPDYVQDNYFYKSKNEKKKHEGVRLSDSLVLPVVVKNERNDSQDSSFEQGDISSVKSKKKKKHDKRRSSDAENPVLIEENQYDSLLTNFSPNQNEEFYTKLKKKKKHSHMASETSGLCSDQSTAQSGVDVFIKAKKKRKSGSENNTHELVDSALKVENDAETNFSVFNSLASNNLPSFLDTLCSYEFDTPDSSKANKKKKKSKKSDV